MSAWDAWLKLAAWFWFPSCHGCNMGTAASLKEDRGLRWDCGLGVECGLS